MADTHIRTVGDLIDHLAHFPRHLPVFIEDEDFSDVGLGWNLGRVGLSDQVWVAQKNAEVWEEVEEEEGGDRAIVLQHYSP